MENMEFKGTKGKWEIHKQAFCCVVSDKILVANCGGRTSNVDTEELIKEQRANAQLISKAQEMLEMLREIRNQIEDGRTYITKQDITNLIKEATTI